MELDTRLMHYLEGVRITMNVLWDFTIAKVKAQHIFAETLKVILPIHLVQILPNRCTDLTQVKAITPV